MNNNKRTQAVLVMNFPVDVFTRDLADQYAKGQMSLLDYTEAFYARIEEGKNQNIELA